MPNQFTQEIEKEELEEIQEDTTSMEEKLEALEDVASRIDKQN